MASHEYEDDELSDDGAEGESHGADGVEAGVEVLEVAAPPPAAVSARDTQDDKARADLGWPQLLEHLAARAHTDRGAAAARVLEPSRDTAWIRGRVAEVSEARALWDRGEPMPFGNIRDLTEHLARADKGGHLDGPSLREVGHTLDAGRRIRRHLAARGGAGDGLTPRLAGRATLIAELADIAAAISDSFDDLGQLLDTASPALGPLRRKATLLRDDLDRRSHALLDHPLIAPHLQDRFYTRREDRFVLPIRVDARTRVKGIVHGISGSGHTVFVEPEEIVDLNNRLKLAELEVTEEERRILGQLTLLVTDAVKPIRVNLEILSELDLIDAGARLAIDLRASEPTILDEPGVPPEVPPEVPENLPAVHARRGEARTAPPVEGGRAGPPLVDLRRARHPLMVLSGRECVPNDIVVDRGHTLVISGPNAGGKTVALKTAGLLSLMARAGLHVPAQEGSSLPLFARVLTDVGDDQSLEKNLSTFSAHLMHLNAFLEAAGGSVLILLDEIAVGTDPDQGAALAEAVLGALADRGATVIVTTHYERLKAMASADPRFENASVGFDMTHLRPTYELHLGVPGASGAFVVARRLGLPEAIAARAEALLGGGSRAVEQLLNHMAVERQRMRAATEAAEEAQRAAEEERRHIEALAVEAEARVKAARKAEHDEAVEALRRARVELDRLRTGLKQRAASTLATGLSKEEVERAEKAIDGVARSLKEHAPAPPPLPGRPPQPGELVAGMEVIVARIGGRGVVSAAPRGGKVVVQAGALKLTVDESEVLIPHGHGGGGSGGGSFGGSGSFGGGGRRAAVGSASYAAGGEKRSAPSTPVAAPNSPSPEPGAKPTEVRTPGNSLDLRGERVDAAIALAEKFLDEAMRTGQDAVYLIHGHGTGALRAALREHLGGFPGIAAMRPGVDSEGGDGVTVITLG